MKGTTHAQSERAQRGSPAADRTAKRALNAKIHHSPRMLAQRQQLERAFGLPVQRQGLEEEEPQMKAVPGVLQRRGPEEEEELLQGKFAPIQRQGLEEEEELLQGKFATVQRQSPEEEELLQGRFANTAAPIQLEDDSGAHENRTGMPDHLKAGVEALSGLDLSDVRVHYGSDEPSRLNALAYTQGTDIHVAPGQEKHLPHEAWHVVQQAQGRVKPTMQMQDGVPVNDDEGLEQEADLMGAKALQMRLSEKSAFVFPIHAVHNSRRMIAQRKALGDMFSNVQAAAAPVAQRLLNESQRGPLENRCLALEGEIEAATGQLPDIIQQTYRADHPVIELIRAQLLRVRAPFETNDNDDITAKLDDYENTIVAVEGNINANLAQIQTVARVWTTFAGELGDLTADLIKITKAVYAAKASASLLGDFNRKLQRKVALDSKSMSSLRKTNVLGAINRVANYVSLGYVTIDPLNSFYASSYDAAQDDFGAAANLRNNTSSGAMVWLNEWEFHIHASVVRAGGPDTPVTGFTIKKGHIKPTNVARDTGTSITVPVAMHPGVIATSTSGVVRWAKSKRAEQVLCKQ